MSNILQRIFTPNWVVIDMFPGETYTRRIGTRQQFNYLPDELKKYIRKIYLKLNFLNIEINID